MKDQCIRQKQSEERTYEQATLELKRQKRAMYLEMEHGCQLQLQLSVHKQHLAAGSQAPRTVCCVISSQLLAVRS